MMVTYEKNMAGGVQYCPKPFSWKVAEPDPQFYILDSATMPPS